MMSEFVEIFVLFLINENGTLGVFQTRISEVVKGL